MTELPINTGIVFLNKNKRFSYHPDYKGTVNVDGVIKEIALWGGDHNMSAKWFNIKVQVPYKPKPEPPKGPDQFENKL